MSNPTPPDPPRPAKPRPYLRAVRRISDPVSKPRYRLVKIDEAGRRRQITVSVVNAVLPIVEREFLRT